MLNNKKKSTPRDFLQVRGDDCTLLRQVRRGDEQGLITLYDRYSKLVYAVALRVLHNSASAEDVLQEIFLQLWLNSERFETAEGTLCRLLTVVARNRAIDLLRGRRPVDTLEGVTLVSSYNLANHAEQNLMCEKARSVIAELPVEQRKLLELAYFEGMSHTEIAAITGRPLGTIKSSIRSGLSTLRRYFQDVPPARVATSVVTVNRNRAGFAGEVAR